MTLITEGKPERNQVKFAERMCHFLSEGQKHPSHLFQGPQTGLRGNKKLGSLGVNDTLDCIAKNTILRKR